MRRWQVAVGLVAILGLLWLLHRGDRQGRGPASIPSPDAPAGGAVEPAAMREGSGDVPREDRITKADGDAPGRPTSPAGARGPTAVPNEGAPAAAQGAPPGPAAAAERVRRARLEELSRQPTPEITDSIAAALAWLALHQAPDGQISDPGAKARCGELGHSQCTYTGTSTCGDDETCAMVETSLCVLTLLDFKDTRLRGLFEPTLDRAVAWLRALQHEGGGFRLGDGHYDFDAPFSFREARGAFPVLALARVAASTGNDDLRRVAHRGLLHLLRGQGKDGGFGGSVDGPSSIEVTLWTALAIDAGRAAGIEVPDAATERLLAFVEATWSAERKLSPDTHRNQPWTYPEAILLAIVVRKEPLPATLDDWRRWADTRSATLYEWFLRLRIAPALGPEPTEVWRDAIDRLDRRQEREGPSSGSFYMGGVRSSSVGGTVLSTCLAVLILELAVAPR